MLATFTVTKAYDGEVDSSGDAPGTLRQAIFDANDADNLGGVPDIIHFHPNLTGKTITLGKDAAGVDLNLGSEAGELKITEAVTIDAQGKDITIDATGNDNTPGVNDGQGSRVIDIAITALAGETQKVTLDGLTITGGDTPLGKNGGGVSFVGNGSGDVSLAIRNSTISGNATKESGGGIFSTNRVEEENSFSGNKVSGTF